MANRSELAQAVREAGVKCSVLHEARMEAHAAMREASNQHEFLVRCCQTAQNEEAAALHRLKQAIERETWESIKK